MPSSLFEIRVCLSCGLRYPITAGNSFGPRCPHCLGETEVALSKEISGEHRTNPVPAADPIRSISVLIDNIRSAGNVGSILRSADGFGFKHAYLCGITPTPENPAVAKTSLGAEESVTWSYHKDAVKLVIGLRKEGFRIFALEDHARATDISGFQSTLQRAVLILGSEVTGVDPALLELSEEVYYIPMRGEKRSFNVANAFSIAAYAIVEQRF